VELKLTVSRGGWGFSGLFESGRRESVGVGFVWFTRDHFQNLGFSESFGEVVFALDTAGDAWNFEQFHSPRKIEPVADCIFFSSLFLFSNSAGWIGLAISNAELSKLTP
jgi:hypothetical protein